MPPKRKVHFIGICGKAMGPIAVALVRRGWEVTGSDEAYYSPIKEFLEDADVVVAAPYAAENVPAEVEMVVVGKRVAEANVELRYVIDAGIPFQSFPEFLKAEFLRHSRNAVVAGGVGKTTTTAMLTWILEANDWKPDYLVGGMAENLGFPARFAQGKFAVLEGDEYASCFNDPRSKFLHYAPETAIITNIIEDHPDLYPDLASVIEVFAELAKILPSHGCLILPDDDERNTQLVAAGTPAQVCTVGFSERATHEITVIELGPDSSTFRFMGADFVLPICGLMNIRNAAMAVVAASHWELSPEDAAQAAARFSRSAKSPASVGDRHVHGGVRQSLASCLFGSVDADAAATLPRAAACFYHSTASHGRQGLGLPKRPSASFGPLRQSAHHQFL